MATILNTNFNSFEPIELKYSYYRNEPLQLSLKGWSQGLEYYNLAGLDNFQDITINRGSCFVLTSTVNLSSFFSLPKTYKLGEIPGSIKISPRNLNTNYVKYSLTDNSFTLTNTSSADATSFFLNIKNNKSALEIIINNKYLQVDNNYPFIVRIDDKIEDPLEMYRQEFYCDIYGDYITLKTRVNDGSFRYLAVGKDNILRATGVILNSQIVNDYFFKILQNSFNTILYDFNPQNNWITYFLDFPAQTYNKDVTLNKVFSNLNTNFLFDFPIEPAVKNGDVVFNLANLKTNFTPTGNPPQIDNSYNEQIITTN